MATFTKSFGFLDDREFQQQSYFDKPPFRAYRDLVLGVLAGSKKPLCTREIHAKLKAQAKPAWTMDALESIGVEIIRSCPVNRYAVARRRK